MSPHNLSPHVCQNLLYVYTTEHLLKELQLQQSKLIFGFCDARRNKRKSMWKLINSEYCLFVDRKCVQSVHPPDSDNSDSNTNTDY